MYRRALSADYGNVDRRLRLARALAAAGRPAEAAQALRVCLQLRPEMAEARALLSDCEARAATAPATGP